LGPARLSEREQQGVALAALGRSNKLITYELGLAVLDGAGTDGSGVYQARDGESFRVDFAIVSS
jgi:hypothetical protein